MGVPVSVGAAVLVEVGVAAAGRFVGAGLLFRVGVVAGVSAPMVSVGTALAITGALFVDKSNPGITPQNNAMPASSSTMMMVHCPRVIEARDRIPTACRKIKWGAQTQQRLKHGHATLFHSLRA
jgi:hypothetical protein